MVSCTCVSDGSKVDIVQTERTNQCCSPRGLWDRVFLRDYSTRTRTQRPGQGPPRRATWQSGKTSAKPLPTPPHSSRTAEEARKIVALSEGCNWAFVFVLMLLELPPPFRRAWVTTLPTSTTFTKSWVNPLKADQILDLLHRAGLWRYRCIPHLQSDREKRERCQVGQFIPHEGRKDVQTWKQCNQQTHTFQSEWKTRQAPQTVFFGVTYRLFNQTTLTQGNEEDTAEKIPDWLNDMFRVNRQFWALRTDHHSCQKTSQLHRHLKNISQLKQNET